MSNLKNNLFYYATKELSQDAFICWLCSFALQDVESTDTELASHAHKLVCEFMEKCLNQKIEGDEVLLKSIEKQVGNIDVLLTTEYKGKTYKIIIEDKTHTSEHDDQLQRYRDQLKDENAIVIGVYFKTGFQSDYSKVMEAGYGIYTREDILRLLEDCDSENEIFRDYLEYWKDFETIAKAYRTQPLDKWPDWQTVNGFFDEAQKDIEETGWWAGYGYVPNQSGGFWGLWFGPDDDRIVYDDFNAALYLQTECKWNSDEGRYDFRICLKLENKSETKDNDWILKLRDKIVGLQGEYGFDRPKRLGWGATMTVGEYNCTKYGLSYEELSKCLLDSIEAYKELINLLRDNSKR